MGISIEFDTELGDGHIVLSFISPSAEGLSIQLTNQDNSVKIGKITPEQLELFTVKAQQILHVAGIATSVDPDDLDDEEEDTEDSDDEEEYC